MTVANVSASNAQTKALAAQLAARAQYLKTGIDKDAAIGDPDHDASAPKSTPGGVQLTANKPAAANVLTLNTASPSNGNTPAGATQAYTAATTGASR